MSLEGGECMAHHLETEDLAWLVLPISLPYGQTTNAKMA